MGNKNDGKSSTESKVYAKAGDVEKYGNSDAKALASVYNEFTKDGVLNSKEVQALKDMDKVLKGAELICGFAGEFDPEVALVVQEQDNTTFLLTGADYKQKNKNRTPQK